MANMHRAMGSSARATKTKKGRAGTHGGNRTIERRK